MRDLVLSDSGAIVTVSADTEVKNIDEEEINNKLGLFLSNLISQKW